MSNGDARRDLLVWTGHVTDRMYGRLEKDQVFPALFLSERDPDPKAPPKPFRRRVHGLPEFHDEICIIADEDRAMLRRGSNIQRVSLRDASELWLASSAGT